MVGEKIIEKMSNKTVMEHTSKRTDQAVLLNAGKVGKTGAKNENLTIQIDPQLMFQRLVIAGEDQFTDNSQLFQHELVSVPPSNFDNNGLPREATAASLTDALWNDSHCMADVSEEKQQYCYVLDGGSLINGFHGLLAQVLLTFSKYT